VGEDARRLLQRLVLELRATVGAAHQNADQLVLGLGGRRSHRRRGSEQREQQCVACPYGATLPTVPRPAQVATLGVAATAVYQGSAPVAGRTML
jgi:hypothetical protein